MADESKAGGAWPPGPFKNYSPTVLVVLKRYNHTSVVRSVDLIRDTLIRHREYGGKRASKVVSLYKTPPEMSMTVAAWLGEIGTFFDSEKTKEFHGRLLVAGLAVFDTPIRPQLIENDFLRALLLEIKELPRILTRMGKAKVLGLIRAIEIRSPHAKAADRKALDDLRRRIQHAGKGMSPDTPSTPGSTPEEKKPASEEKPPTSGPTPPPPDSTTALRPHGDQPATEDLLGREGFAKALALRLRTVYWQSKQGRGEADPFFLHLHGPWGSGKTSVLNFLGRFLQNEPEKKYPGMDHSMWIVVKFNAWRHQRIEPPWWPLMNAVYRQGCRQLRERNETRREGRLVARSWLWRGKGSWAPPLIAFGAVMGVICWLAFAPAPTASWERTAGAVKVITAILGLLTSVWVTSLALSRGLMVGSARAAQNYTQHHKDPMPSISVHFKKLVQDMGYPVAVFIDDLDRCDAKYVVSFLESVQTLFRDAPVTYVVASDRRWLHTSFTKAYKDFEGTISEPGRPVGHLFLEKTFQLSSSIPALDKDLARQFWLRLLSREAKGTPEIQEISEKARKAVEAKTLEEVRQLLREPHSAPEDPGAALEAHFLRQHAAVRRAGPETESEREHALAKFAPLLEPNPRAMKRLVNAFALQEFVAEQLRLGLETDNLALWTILVLRWPLLAEELEKNPKLVQSIGKSGKPPDRLSEELKALFRHADVNDVKMGRFEGKEKSRKVRLTSAVVEKCARLRSSSTSAGSVA